MFPENQENKSGISCPQFIKLIQLSAPQFNVDMVSRFFQLYDTDGRYCIYLLCYSSETLIEHKHNVPSGFVDFKEIICCLSVLCDGTVEDKMRLCFDGTSFLVSYLTHSILPNP